MAVRAGWRARTLRLYNDFKYIVMIFDHYRLVKVATVFAALMFFIGCIVCTGCRQKSQAQYQSDFTFAYMSDVHIALGGKSVEDAEDCVRDINANPNIAFSILAGDITEFGTDEEIALAKSIFDKLDKPYYIVAGNHDAKWSESGCNTFVKEFGYEEFEFDYGGIKFIGTNSGPNMRMAPALLPRESMVWLDSLSKTVDPKQPVFFVNHYPMDTSMLNYGQVLDILKRMNTQLIMNGHWHQDRAMEYEGIPGMIGRSTMATGKEGPGYTIVEIFGPTVTFSERIADQGKTNAPWHILHMTKRAPFDASKEYPRTSYAVNEQYPNVKTIWKFQDNSDIGAGAVMAAGAAMATGAVMAADASAVVPGASAGAADVCAADGIVVYTNTAGYVCALSGQNGSVLWKYKTDGKVFSTPAVSGNTVVVGSTDNHVYALDLDGGSLKWKYRCGKSVLGSPTIYGGVVYIGASDNCFRALDLKTGGLVWEYTGIKGFIESKAFADSDQIVVGDWANTLYSFNPQNGKLQWSWSNKGSRMLSPAAVFPAKANGKIFIATPERVSYALDAKTGKQLWRARGGRESVGLSPDKNHYYIKTMMDTVFAYSTADPAVSDLEAVGVASSGVAATPQIHWSSDAGFGYEIAPTPITSIAGEGKDGAGLLFVPTDKGNIIALNCKDGSIAWKHRFSSALINYIQPLGGNRILVSAMDGFVGVLEY